MGFFKPRFVLIMGASGRLGSRISSLFLRQGNHVALHYHKRRSAVEKLFKEALKPQGKAPGSFICQSNLEDRKSLEKMFQTIGNHWPSIDVVVNSAGLIDDLPAIRMSEVRWDSVLNVNLTGPFLCMRMAAEIMIRENGGHIINIGS
ncbi:MAG TPA: SDR family NAD(P)-dependent oxidoreductase, partial [Nitrospiria bacterium]|nr:SDR family NAD(P)-dependent oxidoreductase [Nitrospiria bacterium]